jgi:transcription elongation factor GreA
MADKITYITPKGLTKLEQELDYLRTTKRQEVVRYLQEMTSNIDDPEYLYAQDEQAFVEGRIRTLEDMLTRVQIIEPGNRGGVVEVGSTIVIKEDDSETETYMIVGSAEANPTEGLISDESPIGKALIGSRVGDIQEVRTPSGNIRLKIIALM